MITRIPKFILILVTFFIAIIVYWPSMNGQPIWDDLSYLFEYNVIVSDFPYSTIWRDFGWPVSVSLHKLLYQIWHQNYFNFHLLNFFIHFINSILILNIAEKLKLPFARLLFVLFLLHPANVITVSWMIQFKTLLCLFFALISFIFLLKSEINKKYFLVSWIFFALSLLSKSSSITLPVFFFLFLRKSLKGKKLAWLLPFFLISLISGFRILTSPVTTESLSGLRNANESIAAKTSSNTAKERPKQIKTEAAAVYPTQSKGNAKFWKDATIRVENFLSTIHYYFWQALLPVENTPVKGLNYGGIGMIEFINIFFVALVVLLNWGTSVSRYLLLGHLMLVPFLGVFTAPYMNLTLVSDQHLYMALPFFICFWLSILSLWKFRYASLLPLFFIPVYIFRVIVTTPYYKNEIAFYSASLDTDALNVPIAYNLAIAYLKAGDKNQAMNVTSSIVSMSKVVPEVLNNKYFTYIYILDLQLQETPIQKDQK